MRFLQNEIVHFILHFMSDRARAAHMMVVLDGYAHQPIHRRKRLNWFRRILYAIKEYTLTHSLTYIACIAHHSILSLSLSLTLTCQISVSD